MKNIHRINLSVLFWYFFISSAFAQLPQAPMPQFQSFPPASPTQSYSTPPTHSNGSNANTIIEQQNREAIRRSGSTPPPTQAEIRQRLAYQQQMVQMKTEKQKQELYATLNRVDRSDNSSMNKKTYVSRFKFANHSSSEYISTSRHFEAAYNELEEMLSGRKPLDLKRAIFLSETPYLNNQIPYDEYNKKIQEKVNLTKRILKNEGLDINNKTACNYAIQKLFTDTIKETGKDGKAKIHYPYVYDFEDFAGDKDYTKYFVSKALSQGKGQCHSLPLLYLAIASELNTEAFISYAPEHSYIKFRNSKGTFSNFETTNGFLTTDAWVTGSNYIQIEGIRNKIYTDTVGVKKVIAQCLIDLSNAFERKFGNDEFMAKCATLSLKHYPNNVYSYMTLANLTTANFDKELAHNGYPKYSELYNYPELKKKLDEMHRLYDLLDNLGYSEMPKGAYEGWLKSLEQEKQKQENQKLYLDLKLDLK